MMRVGAMWKALARSGAEYYSFNVTDRRGVKWQANAVRNEDLADGEWVVVPLADGQTERIMLTGDLQVMDDDTLAGTIESYDFAMNFIAVPSANKTEDSDPDFHIEITSPAKNANPHGLDLDHQVTNDGQAYYSMAFHGPQGGQHRANALQRDDAKKGAPKIYEIVPLAEPRMAAVA